MRWFLAQADVFSLQGIAQLSQTIQAVRQYCNPDLKILSIVLTRHNTRSILDQDLEVRHYYLLKYLPENGGEAPWEEQRHHYQAGFW